MKILSTINQFREWRDCIRGTVGFVPTMGAIHDGHISLVEKSYKHCENTIVSIYLNPTQFSPNEDLGTYPKNIKKDINKLSKTKSNCIFLPSDSEMYPKGFKSVIQLSNISNVLEGKRRPHFFHGVTTIVSKLFNIIQPSHAFFGEKDAQQLRVIKQMVIDLNFPIKIISCPTIREHNGLAISSRNQYLTNEEHEKAAVIYRSLQLAKKLIFLGERRSKFIRKQIINEISSESILSIDYVSVADSYTMKEVSSKIEGDVLVSVAAYLGNTRLIDNFTFSLSSDI